MSKRLLVKIPAEKNKSYPIWIAVHLLTSITRWIPDNNDIVIITDHSVKKLYGNSLATLLKKQGKNILLISFPPGEKSKTIKTKWRLETNILKKHYHKNALILALGGGVVGDIAGFIAATYMRGIDFIQIPTTLLAMVDSSVGGKTGIDTPQGKNLIGAYWQPKAVITDLNCLKTLPSKQLINGLIEALKMFLTSDAKSFHYANKNIKKILDGDTKTLANIIHRAVTIKATIVQQDEKDTNLRMILNFGHTIGHALEYISRYKIMHGIAVALGILLEAKMAVNLKLLSEKHFNFIIDTFSKLGITTHSLKKYNINQIIKATKIDKKSFSHTARYVILTDVGKVHSKNNVIAQPVKDKIVKQAYLDLTEH